MQGLQDLRPARRRFARRESIPRNLHPSACESSLAIGDNWSAVTTRHPPAPSIPGTIGRSAREPPRRAGTSQSVQQRVPHRAARAEHHQPVRHLLRRTQPTVCRLQEKSRFFAEPVRELISRPQIGSPLAVRRIRAASKETDQRGGVTRPVSSSGPVIAGSLG